MKEKECEIYEFVKKYVNEYGFSPSIREIGKGVGLSSSSSVHHYVESMIDKGFLTQKENKPRTLRVVPIE